MPGYTSIVLTNQLGLFTLLNPSIITNISSDGHTLTVSNISEQDINKITLVSNLPANNSIMKFEKIQVTLNGDFNPIVVPGLNSILAQKINVENASALINNKPTFQPFIKGFKGAPGVNQLIDKLSGLSGVFPETQGKIKSYIMTFSNDTQPSISDFPDTTIENDSTI